MRNFISIIKNDKKNKIIVGVVVLVLALTAFGIYSLFGMGDPKFDDVNVTDNITISDINILTEEGVTTYTGTLTVKESETINGVKIKIIDKDEKEIVTLIGYVGKNVNTNEEIKIKASTDEDISNMNDITYELIK